MRSKVLLHLHVDRKFPHPTHFPSWHTGAKSSFSRYSKIHVAVHRPQVQRKLHLGTVAIVTGNPATRLPKHNKGGLPEWRKSPRDRFENFLVARYFKGPNGKEDAKFFLKLLGNFWIVGVPLVS